MSIKNLRIVLELSLESDWEISRKIWWRYHNICKKVAEVSGFNVRVGAGVFSALSPNNDYLGNLRDAARMMRCAAAGMGMNDFKVSTYNPNKLKAWKIVKGAEPLDLLVAPKTRNFYVNIANPLDDHAVTIDGHIYNVWDGKRIPLHSKVASERIKASPKKYNTVADAIRKIAKEKGCRPSVVQSVLWHTWKRIHNIRMSTQTEFWGSDYIAAGLGFKQE